jgi:two-component system sensor histidine kinase DctS
MYAPAVSRWSIWWLAAVIGLLLAAALTALVWLAFKFEANANQKRLDSDTQGNALAIRNQLQETQQALAVMGVDPKQLNPGFVRRRADVILASNPELLRVEWRDAEGRVVAAVDSPFTLPRLSGASRRTLGHEGRLAWQEAGRLLRPLYSHSYYVPIRDNAGIEVMDLFVPILDGSEMTGALVAVYSLPAMLVHLIPPEFAQLHEISFMEPDGTYLARRAAMGQGRRVYTAQAVIDLPGHLFMLSANSLRGKPDFIPNLLTATVVLLAFLLVGAVVLLARDIRQRQRAENALREQHAFRQAMEDSLVTGLRARDLFGRITYVNPAFCEMVGYSAGELMGHQPPMPYWAPEAFEKLQEREAQVMSGVARPAFETIYKRKNGERFRALVHTAPLIDAKGRHTGWMSSILDVTDQKRMEELSRQQQERLQSTARLATMGEVASTLSHELNQPLAAISSFAAGCLNMVKAGTITPQELQQALSSINQQAQRAGQVIRSVHDFVRRRGMDREAVALHNALQNIMPLFELRARKSGIRIAVDMPASLPAVEVDRVMLEQVMLNLARNAFDSMEDTPSDLRELKVSGRLVDGSGGPAVQVAFADRGSGIPAEVAAKLFTPFFTTKSEGMGMGLNVCRTVIEQHAGRLWFEAHLPGEQSCPGTVFKFTLPAAAAEA